MGSAAAGLVVVEEVEVPFSWVYADLEEAIGAQFSAGPVEAAVRHSGREAVEGALRGFSRSECRRKGRCGWRSSFAMRSPSEPPAEPPGEAGRGHPSRGTGGPMSGGGAAS